MNYSLAQPVPAVVDYGEQSAAPPRMPLSWYYEQHDEIRKRTLELLSKMDDPDALRPVAWTPGVHCTVRWILQHVIEHEPYHIGQAVMLSLMRAKLDVEG